MNDKTPLEILGTAAQAFGEFREAAAALNEEIIRAFMLPAPGLFDRLLGDRHV